MMYAGKLGSMGILGKTFIHNNYLGKTLIQCGKHVVGIWFMQRGNLMLCGKIYKFINKYINK